MNPTHGLAKESKQDRIEEHTCRQALGPLDSFVVFQVLVFRVNVAEEANSNTRSGKSSHSSDDFPEFEAAAAFTQLGQKAKPRQKLDRRNCEIDGSHMSLQQFDKF